MMSDEEEVMESIEEIARQLTDEEIEAVNAERRRRMEEKEKALKEGFTKRPRVFAVCPKCKTWFTEEDVSRYETCPVCGSEVVEPI